MPWFMPIGPVEHNALTRILRGPPNGGAADADRLRADQDAFRVETVEDDLEPLPFAADSVLLGNPQILDEQHVRIHRMPAHLVDQAHLDLGSIEIGVEKRQAFGLAFDLVERCRAGQQQHLVGHLRGRDPDLLAVHEIAAVAPFGARLQLGGVEPHIGLRDGKAHLVLARDDRRQDARLLLLACRTAPPAASRIPAGVCSTRRPCRHPTRQLPASSPQLR